MDPSEDKPDRFRTVISIAIAMVTVVGALTAWRITIASDEASSADSQGLAAVQLATNSDMETSMFLTLNLMYFAEYRQHIELAQLLERDAAAMTDSTRRTALREQAMRERNLAATARNYVDADYVTVNPATGEEQFNQERYLSVQRAEVAASQDIDYDNSFKKADIFRDKVRGLLGVTIALSTTLFLFTAALASRGRRRYLLTGAGVLLFLAATCAAIVLERTI